MTDEHSIPSKRSVYYRNNSYTIAPQYQAVIQAHAVFLREHPNIRVRVEGNRDERGSSALNLALGQRRADMIKRVRSCWVQIRNRSPLHPGGDEQRCWNHKIVNVLDALGKKDQAAASEYLRAMMCAESRSACQKKRDEFVLR